MGKENSAKSVQAKKRKERLIDILACLTLGHLCFLPIWELVIGGTPRLFLLDDSLGIAIFAPILVLTVLLTILGITSLYLREAKFRRLGGTAWIIFIIFAAFSLCRIFVFSLIARKISFIGDSANIKIIIMILWILFLLIALFWVGLERWVSVTRKIMLVISPLLLLIWFQVIGLVFIWSTSTQPQQKGIQDSHKTIWVFVFDELDAKIVMDGLPKQSGMLEIPIWKNFCFNGINAYPPAGNTVYSISSMISGKQFGHGPVNTDYEFTKQKITEDGLNSNWDWSDSLFHDFSSQGNTSAVIGWAFPYAPLYGKYVNSMYWVSLKSQESALFEGLNFFSKLKVITLEAVFGPISFALINKESRSIVHRLALQKIDQYIDQILNGPFPELVWIHSPVPHWPAIKGSKGTYLDNLQEVDRQMANFRKRLSLLRRFDEATILVLGDHWFRKPSDKIILETSYNDFIGTNSGRWNIKDHRVPFLLKLPNQNKGKVHSSGFNTIILRELINALHKGELNSPEEVSMWLDHHTPYVESPSTLANP